MLSQKGFAPLILLIIGVLVISSGIIGGSLYLKNNFQKNVEIAGNGASISPQPTIKATVKESTFSGIIIHPFGVATSSAIPVDPNVSIDMPKRLRDAQRLSDLANLQQAINVSAQESTGQGSNVLCNGVGAPCFGSSNDTIAITRKVDGTGWVKVDLSKQKSVRIPQLPIDPFNNNQYHYVYCADSTGWEIDTTLESDEQEPKLKNDGGDDNNLYEVGSNLALVNRTNGCKY